MLPTKFRFIWPSGFRGEDFLKSANQKQELPVVAMFVNGSGRNEQFYRGPSIDASYQVFLAHLAKGNVIFCHHLASVVRRLSSVNFSHFNLLL
jgi:hypothetical protein